MVKTNTVSKKESSAAKRKQLKKGAQVRVGSLENTRGNKLLGFANDAMLKAHKTKGLVTVTALHSSYKDIVRLGDSIGWVAIADVEFLSLEEMAKIEEEERKAFEQKENVYKEFEIIGYAKK